MYKRKKLPGLLYVASMMSDKPIRSDKDSDGKPQQPNVEDPRYEKLSNEEQEKLADQF